MKRRSRWILKGGKLKAHIVEEDVVQEIEKRLWLQYRIKVWRIRERIPRPGERPSTPGIPDLIGWIPRNIERVFEWKMGPVVHHGFPAAPLFIECKRPGGAHRIAQTRFIDEARQDGCVAFFASSWGDVVREMGEQCGIKLKEAV